MAVECRELEPAATQAYFKHFLSHWSYNKNLISKRGAEIYNGQLR